MKRNSGRLAGSWRGCTSRSLRTRLALPPRSRSSPRSSLFAIVTVLVVGTQLRGSLDTRAAPAGRRTSPSSRSRRRRVLTRPRVRSRVRSPAAQIVVEVIDARGRILARSLTLGAERAARRTRSCARRWRRAATGIENITVDGQPFRMFVAPIADVSGPASGGAVLVASDTSDISSTLHHLGVVVALSGAGIVLLAALAAALLTRRRLRPLRRLAPAGGRDRADRGPIATASGAGDADEIGQLTGVLNRMLVVARAGTRGASAGFSPTHRTSCAPRSRHCSETSSTSRGTGPTPRCWRTCAATPSGWRGWSTTLLGARAGRARPRRRAGPVELDELVRVVVAEHDGGRVTAGRTATPVTVAGDRDALQRLLENLIENALVHGPAGGLVIVSAEVGQWVGAADRARRGNGA